jgi:hypothetical protein
MYKIIQQRDKERPSIYNVDSYTIIDNGDTVRFYDDKHKEFKRIPYKNVRIIELVDDEN